MNIYNTAAMRLVAIIGAGELGATIARTLAGRDSISEIRLIDEAVGIASGKALDIQQAGPIERFDTRVVADGDIRSAVGAGVVVVADRAGTTGGEWSGEPALALLRQLSRLGMDGTLVCAGASQLDLVERGVLELGLARERVLGSAPEALVSALRALIALEANASPRQVGVSILGVPPARLVVPWSEASIAGSPLPSILDSPSLGRMRQRLMALWPPGPYALASAASAVAEALLLGGRQFLTCHVMLDGELGARRAGSAFPVQLGAGGIGRYRVPLLNPKELVLFENAVAQAR